MATLCCDASGCEAVNSEDIVAWLNSQPPESLIIQGAMMSVSNLQPVIDGRVVVANPTEVYASGDFAKVKAAVLVFL